jgi:hypothetical protein
MKEWVLTGSHDTANSKSLEMIGELRVALIERIEGYIRNKSSQDYEVKKLIELKKTLSEGIDIASDENWFIDVMDYAKLHDELGSEE